MSARNEASKSAAYYKKRAEKAEAEVERLRKLCAEAAEHGDCNCWQDDTCPFIRLSAAGRGE